MRSFKACEKGNATGLLIAAFVLILAGLAVFLVLRWYLGGSPKTVVPTPPPTVVSSVGAFKGDPAEATEKLLKALNQKLQDLDLLKLLAADVQTSPATVHGKSFLTYQEEFRLPSRFSPEQLGGWLEETARAQGAKLISSANMAGMASFLFAYDTRWIPVQINFTPVKNPRVCLIIDDGGYKKGEALESLYAFKVPVTVAIIPDAEFSTRLAEELPSHGVEVMCHMPMEGHEKGAVGGNYKELLKKGMNPSRAKAIVEKALDSLPNVRGLNNHMGSVATTDPELIWDVCQVLKPRGLFIIDSRTTAQSVVEPVAKKAQVAVTHRDVFLDNVETPEAILKQLKQLVARARKKGVAIGIGHFKLTTLKTLEEAVHKLRDEGIQFVYASEVVKE